ncbi:MAG: FecR family protein [Thiovulaceae bacterium]|nr:FecR family protein [Sulfurimonadaceae bacterium]
MKKLFVLIFALTMWLDATTFAVVKKVEGRAKVQTSQSIKKSNLNVGYELKKGDSIITYKTSKVVLLMQDKTKIVLDAYTKLTLLSESDYKQSGGKVFYKVTKRKGAKGLNVTTPFAIIGVKGTEFVIEDNNTTGEVALNEGLIGVDSPDKKPFELIDKDKVDAKMGGSPDEVNAEFEAYKEQLYKEFAEYVSSFDLEPGKKLSFNGKQVLQSSQGKSDQQMFKLYMSDAEFDATVKELESDVTGDLQSEEDAFSDDFFSED